MQKLIITIAFLCLTHPCLAKEEGVLRLVQTIALPDVEGRIDHFAIDVKRQRAFLAALSKNTVEVVDLKAGVVSRTLSGFAKPQGVRYVAELDKVYVASGNDGSLKTLNGSTLHLLQTANVSLGADAIGYDSQSKILYVGSGGGDANKETGDLTLFSALTSAPIAAITTDAHAGGSVVEEHGRRVYVMIPEKAEVLVLDRSSHTQVAKWTFTAIQKNVAVDLDEKSHRLFLGVRSPASVMVIDTANGNVVATIPTVGTLDGLSFDRFRRRIYTSGGEGFLDVIQQVDADHYEPIARVSTGPNARTSVFEQERHRLYVAIPRDKDRTAELRVFETLP